MMRGFLLTWLFYTIGTCSMGQRNARFYSNGGFYGDGGGYGGDGDAEV